MGRTKKMKISLGVAATVILTFAIWLFADRMTSAEPLTAEEATNKVKELYKGEIVEVNEEKAVYRITIELDTGKYEVEIDRENGDVNRMIRTKKEVASNKEGAVDSETLPSKEPDQNHQKEDSTGELPSQDPVAPQPSGPTDPASQEPNQSQAPSPVKQLSDQEAAAIALSKVAGEVDEIELGESGGISYYLIEIENEGAEEEATVQINAISGEVMSITWDD
jgi:uncharacterized membrane protein YkoI